MDEIAFTFDDLADEEDLQRELERISARVEANRKHVEARYSDDPWGAHVQLSISFWEHASLAATTMLGELFASKF